jgi:hypothetical protein
MVANVSVTEELVDRFSRAQVLEHLPPVVDVRSRSPRNPPPDIQQKYVGASFESAYSEAGRFVQQAVDWAAELRPFDESVRVLDFGAGWGRISRMLLGTVPSSRLYAMDVDQDMVALVESTLPGINCLISQPYPPTIIADGALTHALAFSVFSHLAEDAHAAWAAEFGRVVQPDGLVFITVLDQLFCNQVASCQAEVAAGHPSPFAVSLARMLADPEAARAQYRAGRFVYADPGSDGARTGDFYGWAMAPRPWLERTWGRAGFTIEHWVPSGVLFEQAMVCLRRTDRPQWQGSLSRLRRRAVHRAGRVVRRSGH